MARLRTLLLTALIASLPLRAAEEDTTNIVVNDEQAVIDLMLECMSSAYGAFDVSGDVLYISASQQRLFHVRCGRLWASYPVSTAALGLGTTSDSHRTPTGLHRITEKLGDGVPERGIFLERQFIGAIAAADDTACTDLITSRILWLEGLEEGVNRGGGHDSHDRHIYIHGTPEEGRIGTPASAGCIRMRNADVITLYDDVRSGTLVLILN